MRIVAVAAPGSPTLATLEVSHGADPRVLLWESGFVLVRFLSVSVDGADDLRVTAQVLPAGSQAAPPPRRHRGRDSGLDRRVTPVVKQRVAAYAMVLSGRGLLATRFARTTAVAGTWGLPGGGREAGESPAQTVLREIAEETGQVAAITRLVDLRSDHWVGRSPAGVVEDFHALRLIYAARCAEPTKPVVHDVGGTTAAATWVPLRRWRAQNWAAGTRALLEAHLPELIG